MKRILFFLLIIIMILLFTGLYMQNQNLPYAEKVIGISVLLLVAVLLPLFLYYRYKNKNLQDYILDKEKWEKIKENYRENTK